MSQNRRHDLVGPTIDRLAAADAARGTPQGLPDELVRRLGRRHDLNTPAPVTALVPHQVAQVVVREVRGEVVATTPGGAVLLRWTDDHGHITHAWLWANAVRRQP